MPLTVDVFVQLSSSIFFSDPVVHKINSALNEGVIP